MWQTLGKVIKPFGSLKFGESDKGNFSSQKTYAPRSLLVNENLKRYTNVCNILCVCARLTVHHRNVFSTRHHNSQSPHGYCLCCSLSMQLCIWYWRDVRTLDTIQSLNFLLLYSGAHCLKEARPADPVFIYCPYLSTGFLLYHSPPAPSQSPSCTLSLGVPSQSLFLYGKGILLQCECIPLPFPRSDLHCQWFFIDCLHRYPLDTTSSQNILQICLMHLLIQICRYLVILFVTFQCFAPIQKKWLDITSKNSQLHCNRPSTYIFILDKV